MGRKKLIQDTLILDSKMLIEKGEITLRQRARDLGIHPSSLSDRIKKLTIQQSILKPDTETRQLITKPDTPKVKLLSKPDTNNKLPDIESTKPDTKPDTKKIKRKQIKNYIKLSTTKLRGIYEDLTFNPKIGKGISHRGSRINCINLIIQELEKQKEL